MSNWILSLFLLSLVSCGNSHHSKSKSASTTTTPAATPAETPAQNELAFEKGEYKVTFANVNSGIYSMKGSGKFVLSDSDMNVSITMGKAPILRSIYQNLYKGECPTIHDDRNGDGIVDINEALGKLSHVMIPLDSDLNSSSSAKNNFPHGSLTGKYSYSAKGDMAVMLKELKANGETKNINLEDTVVMLQGLPVFYRFPNSVESSQGLPVTETLPVACGSILKVQ